MSISVVKSPQAFARDVRFDEHMMHVVLEDGRCISIPIEWFPRLRNASERQRKRWRLIGHGLGIHWSDLDEDLSVAALLEA